MQINFNPSIRNNPTYFRSEKPKLNPEQKVSTSPAKPFIYLGMSIIPIGIGILSIKNAQKTINPIIKNTSEKLPKFDSLLPEESSAVQKMIKDGLDTKFAELLVKVKNIENKEEFATEVYNSLFELTGYKTKPNLYISPKAPSGETLGGWNSTSFSMQIYNDTTLKKNKDEIVDTIAHELEHFKQCATILRTETLGAKALIEALAKRFLKLDKENASLCLERYGKKAEHLTIADVNNYYSLNEDIGNLYQFAKKLIAEKGIIKIDSEEGLLAKKYLLANESYTKIDHTASEEKQNIQLLMYSNNLLEEKAFAEGHKIKKTYTDFILKLAESRLFNKN